MKFITERRVKCHQLRILRPFIRKVACLNNLTSRILDQIESLYWSINYNYYIFEIRIFKLNIYIINEKKILYEKKKVLYEKKIKHEKKNLVWKKNYFNYSPFYFVLLV